MICEARHLNDKTSLEYLIYFPDDYPNTEKKFPLVLFLHGAGERGNNLSQIKKHGIPKRIHDGAEFPFITIAPQCADGIWWSNNKNIRTLEMLLQDLICELKVDKNRIYGTGLSMGGYGILDLASTYPNLFAALIPICGGTILNQLQHLTKIPIWMFHGAKDDVIPVESSKLIYEYLNKKNKNNLLTIYPDLAHDSWTTTYENKEIYDWLLSFRKL